MAISRELAPGLLPYINLFPSDDPAYYRDFVDVVKPSLISFDRYPLLSEGREDANYFHNWAIVRDAALHGDIPSWVFIQTLAYNNHREPTAAELLWQVNISLAYGAKGIQYFTYWTPEAARGEGFGPALITVDGRRTPRYAAAQKINTTWLHQVGRELKPLVSESVAHANETPLPNGAVGFTPDQPGHPASPVARSSSAPSARATPPPPIAGCWSPTAPTAPAPAPSSRRASRRSRPSALRARTRPTRPSRSAPVPFDLAPGAATLVKLGAK